MAVMGLTCVGLAESQVISTMHVHALSLLTESVVYFYLLLNKDP